MVVRCFFPRCHRTSKHGHRTPARSAGAKRHGETEVAAAADGAEDRGAVRVRLVVTRGEFLRIMASAGVETSSETPRRSARRAAPDSLEELRRALRRWRLREEAETVSARRAAPWSPVLQTIPEE